MRFGVPKFNSLQHLPDFKGIETQCQGASTLSNDLQHLPDFKGIETAL